jgi:crotonobetainyl-CoA:carnitine CoA-transferase CaiB-like acyl-CoA transferase
LQGIRVLDLSRVVSGPLCGRILADLGADVVKIEPPDLDRTRTVPPHIDGMSPYFAQMNAGKRNLGVDLKAPGAPDLIRRLARVADVVVENFRAGVLAQSGLDAETLLSENPRLVYCSVTGWGQDGPWRDRRAYAPLIHAEIGMVEMAARVRGRRPESEVNQHGDAYPGILAANAVLAALLQRERTGCGQHIDIAMAQAMVYANEWSAVNMHPPQQVFGGFDTWSHVTFRLGDGSHVALVGNPVTIFPQWAPALGARDLLQDPRFATQEARSAHVPELVAVMDELFARVPDGPSLHALAGPWMLVGDVRTLRELAETEWAQQRGLMTEVAPGLSVPAAPWQSSTGTVRAPHDIATYGRDNAAVLAEFLGLGSEDVQELTAAGVLRSAAQEELSDED